MDKQIEEMLKNWKWDKKNIKAMREHPDLKRLKTTREQIYEEIKDMTPEQRTDYLRSASPNYHKKTS